MICPTRLRGLSEAYGSWKIIWISRRTGRMFLRERPISSLPRYLTEPAVGLSS